MTDHLQRFTGRAFYVHNGPHIVGTLLEIRPRPLGSRSTSSTCSPPATRKLPVRAAPPEGLCLMKVDY